MLCGVLNVDKVFEDFDTGNGDDGADQFEFENGFEATAAIREIELTRSGHIPIVAMTAQAGKEDEEKCLAAGMDGYISKPGLISNRVCR